MSESASKVESALDFLDRVGEQRIEDEADIERLLVMARQSLYTGNSAGVTDEMVQSFLLIMGKHDPHHVLSQQIVRTGLEAVYTYNSDLVSRRAVFEKIGGNCTKQEALVAIMAL